MRTYTQTPSYQACQALFEQNYPGFRDGGSRYADLVAAWVTAETAVLDVGAGRMSFAAASLPHARWSVGVDLMLSDLRHNLTLDCLAVADAEALPFPDAVFDLVTSQWVVEHFARPDVAFRELARVLRPGGRIVLFTTNAWNYVPLSARLLPNGVRGRLLQTLLRRPAHESHPVHYRANSRSALMQIARAAGLVLDEIQFVGNPFYLAFSPALFRLALAFEHVTDRPALQCLKLYLLATLRKPN